MDRYGLVGFPLGHSFSRNFFTDKFDSEKIDAEYLNFEIPDIDEFPDIIATHPTLRGLNVTIPYKLQVMDYLDEVTPEARAIGAVNVVKVEHRGKNNNPYLVGYNSDVLGFAGSLEPLLEPHHKKALILGTGGASKAIHYALEKKLGLETLFVSRGVKDGCITYADLTPDIVKEYEVIVNCTPKGMYPHVDECPDIPYEALTDKNLLYDLIYNPEQTLFLHKGMENGAKTKSGLEMLILQAIASWDIWNK